MEKYIVYWAHHKDNHCDALEQGYVGITKNLKEREYAHRRGATNQKFGNFLNKYKDDVIFTVITSFDNKEEAYSFEKELRPVENMGLNISKGGIGGTALTGKDNPNYGKTWSPEYKQNFRLANLGRKMSEEQKRNNSDAQKGKKLSEETKKKMSFAKKGTVMGDGHKRRISEAHLRYHEKKRKDNK